MPQTQQQQTIEQTKQTEEVKQQSVAAGQAVADAVKKVADAAVAEIQKGQPAEPLGEFIFRGTPGGKFEARSEHKFGTGGSISVSGHQLHTTAWGADRIEGDFPAGITSGEVIVDVGNNCLVKAYYRGA